MLSVMVVPMLGRTGVIGAFVLIHADSALYRAKRSGRDRVECYEPTVDVPKDCAPAFVAFDISET